MSEESIPSVEDLDDTGLHMNRKTRRKLRRQVLELEGHDCYASWKGANEGCLERLGGPKCTEIFSVPRVTEMFHGHEKGNAYDLVLGDDFLKSEHRSRVMEDLRRDKPYCVVLSPPRTMFSSRRRPGNDEQEEKRRIREAIVLLNFAVDVCELQLKQGRHFVFEHPFRASSWGCRKLKTLRENPKVNECQFDMCAFGMCDRVSGILHKKGTRILSSFDGDVMKHFNRRCTGDHEHQVLEGKVKIGNEWINRTRLAQEYPQQLCITFRTAIEQQWTKDFRGGHNENSGATVENELLNQVFAVEDLKIDDNVKLDEILRRAHQNLGHPGTERFIQMLKASGPSDNAIVRARRMKCSVCEAQQGLKSVKVSKVRRTYEFNVGVCADTFEVEAGSRKLHMLSLICEGTNYHVAIPLWNGKTASETRKAYSTGTTGKGFLGLRFDFLVMVEVNSKVVFRKVCG